VALVRERTIPTEQPPPVSEVSANFNVNISHKTIQISNVSHTNFLGLTLDSTLSWKPHIDQLISKLN